MEGGGKPSIHCNVFILCNVFSIIYSGVYIFLFAPLPGGGKNMSVFEGLGEKNDHEPKEKRNRKGQRRKGKGKRKKGKEKGKEKRRKKTDFGLHRKIKKS